MTVTTIYSQKKKEKVVTNSTFNNLPTLYTQVKAGQKGRNQKYGKSHKTRNNNIIITVTQASTTNS